MNATSDSDLKHLGITRAQLSDLHDYEVEYGFSSIVRQLIIEELMKDLMNYTEVLEFDELGSI